MAFTTHKATLHRVVLVRSKRHLEQIHRVTLIEELFTQEYDVYQELMAVFNEMSEHQAGCGLR